MRKILFLLLFFAFSCRNSKENAAIDLCKEYLGKILKDPSSLKVYNATATTDSEYGTEWNVTLDYGAKNGFGGMDRETMTFRIVDDLILDINGKSNFYERGGDKVYPPQK